MVPSVRSLAKESAIAVSSIFLVKQRAYLNLALLVLISFLYVDVYLFTSDNQFGFKQKHSTDLCIYTVKSIIQYYNCHSSPVYTCFLDAS